MNDKMSFEEILAIKKDIFPYILQYGVIRFPIGMENTNNIIFTSYGLSHNGEVVSFLT